MLGEETKEHNEKRQSQKTFQEKQRDRGDEARAKREVRRKTEETQNREERRGVKQHFQKKTCGKRHQATRALEEEIEGLVTNKLGFQKE